MVTSLDMLAMLLLIQLRLQLTFAVRLHGWLLFPWLFPRSFLQSCFPAPACPVVWDCPCQRQGFAFELHEVPAIPLLQLVGIHLPSSSVFQCIGCSPWFGIIYELGESVLCPIIPVINMLRY